MPDQLDSNETYENRTEETKRAITSLLGDLGIAESKKLSIYNQNNWGSLSNPVLYTALLKMSRDRELLSAEQILSERNRVPNPPAGPPSVHEEPEEVPEVWVRRRQPVIVKDVSWFINNGETKEIQTKAREYRERVLLDLYLEHVKMTGETYFPEMHRLLKAEWDFSYRDNS